MLTVHHKLGTHSAVAYTQFVAVRQHFMFMFLEEQRKDSELLQQKYKKFCVLRASSYH